MGGTDCRWPALDLYLAENNLQQLGLLADYFSMRPEFAVRGTFTEGSVLLSALRERPVDLVITSLELRGDMDARELLVAMGQAELLCPPRVIVVFDAELPALQARCLQAGADYYLVKPYTLQRLASRALDVCESFAADGQDPLDVWLIRMGLRPGDRFSSCFRCCLQAAMACGPDFALLKEVYIPAAQAGSVSVSAVDTSMRRALKILETRNTPLYRQMAEHFGREHPGKRMTSKALLERLAGLARGG